MEGGYSQEFEHDKLVTESQLNHADFEDLNAGGKVGIGFGTLHCPGVKKFEVEDCKLGWDG